ncbi:MAG TPA: hypothetical protein VMV10_16945 [Pirellulales bacterium]|nr:hypothetical protein [Pirellulales bacterium]
MVGRNDAKITAFITTWLLVGVTASSVHGAEAVERERVARVEFLIECLASKNAAPKVIGDARVGDDQTIKFTKTYDKSAQAVVYLAAKELLGEDEGVIDMLLEHQDDSRYSFSVNSYIDYNVTVSEACRRIAGRKLYSYEPELHVITRSGAGYPDLTSYAGSKHPWAVWWRENKSRGLPQLQLVALDAEIKFMQELDGKTALPWHPDAEPLPIAEFNRRRGENLQTLKAIRSYVAAAKVPYRPKALVTFPNYIFGLPWAGRRHNK